VVAGRPGPEPDLTTSIAPVRWDGDGLVLLDQTRLPGEEIERACSRWEEVAEAIRTLVVRGAPAIGVVRAAHAAGRVALVWVDETRPVMQGSRLTAWECVRDGIPHRLVADVVAASLMGRGEVDLVVTGADRIAANGDTANKIGTYALAVLARHHGVPFYVAAPFSTIDPSVPSGAQIPIEERDPAEVRRVAGRATAPEASPVYNPAFDVTPATLITAIITERGVFRPPYRFSP
jgi:methylthioribose-1-phosphate isomerase